MQKIKTFLKIIVISFALTNYAQSLPTDDSVITDLIIGTWVSENDSNESWIFTENSCVIKYSDTVDEQYSYSISETSPQCGYQVKTGGIEDFYLKIYNEATNEEYCYEIYTVNLLSLSMNYLGSSKKLIFIRQ
jgi:hypothetical protein